MSNIVFIATSLDGYITDKKGGLDWLHAIPNPEQIDMGFGAIMARVDALVMGRKTLEMVLSFGVDWPYSKPVFVLSNTLSSLPPELEGKVFLINGELKEVLNKLHHQGYKELYIDGGKTIQSFMDQDLIDELIISTIPIVLGGGVPLFGVLAKPQAFELIKSEVFLEQITQTHLIRKRD